MIRYIKRPKLLFKKKFSLKNKIYNTIVFENYDYKNVLRLKNNLKLIKDKNKIINTEIIKLKESLDNTFKYDEFLENIKIEKNRIDNKSKALVVVKNNTLLNINNKTKKFAKFSLKSVLISLAISFINLFIWKSRNTIQMLLPFIFYNILI